MSATNLDLPVLVSAEQIRRREFVTTRRGYDPDQVRVYLEQLADQMELMRSMLREARAEAEAAMRTSAQPRVDPYDQLGQRVASVIREADHVAETIRGEALNDVERMTSEARAEADRIRTDAQSKAEEARARADEAVRAAREEADRTIAGLATRRDTLVDQLASMQERLIGVARDLESAIDVKIAFPDMGGVEEAWADEAPASAPEADPAATATEGAGASAEAEDRTIVVGEAEEAPLKDGPAFPDPSYEELWEGTEAIKLELPDIPALDLDWDDEHDPYA